ncbi:hypothetical protein BJ875DRAFT_9381 [Amylocarpus encephaloides]|uniref:Uncharacterized protein n=1 Tax=Amylocarpus encephaloides TaxID=45428 RepID=A0A9P7YJ30_9HELO|nr:hypothetical protein BJ875DRAFT_9381 [Amylocarpus encephaloides]
MSATTATPTSPLHRDIRSASVPFKREKDNGQKWSQGARPGAGLQWKVPMNGDPAYNEAMQEIVLQHGKLRPMGNYRSSGNKTHANRAPKPFGPRGYSSGASNNRLAHKVDAVLESNEPSSCKSLAAILPTHANNTQLSVQTLHPELDAEILYSFDSKGPSPGQKASTVALGGLIEQAEQKWIEEQTEKIVTGEYEVLDAQGEKTVLSRGRKRGSPRQKATKDSIKPSIDEDDGFELV